MNAEAAEHRPVNWYVDHLLADAERFATVLESTPHDAQIAACPGWTLGRLAEHLGQIHRWAQFCVINGRAPTAIESTALESFAPDRAADWLRAGADELAATLSAIDPDAPSWHPFPVEHVAAVWPRRQAHETAIHRWDAEKAAGLDPAIDPELAADGIDEYFELAIPRLVVRERISLPAGSLHVHCTDVDGEWLIWADDAGYQLVRAHQKGDAALRGPAGPLLLRLWGRTGSPADDITLIGDEAVIEDWLSIEGM